MTSRSSEPTILVIHPGALGDVLLGIPALRALRASWPSHRLGMVAGSEVGRLLQQCGEVDTLFPMEGPHLAQLLAGPQAVCSDLRRWLADCEIAVAWMADGDGVLAETLDAFRVRRLVIQPARRSSELDQSGLHQAERLLASLPVRCPLQGSIALGLPESLVRMAGRRLASMESSTGRLVGVHPGSGSRHKCSDPRVLEDVCRSLVATGVTPIVFEGPADGIAVRNLLARLPAIVVRELPLPETAGLLTHLDLFIGHDSGLTQLAALLGCPTVAIFGPTDLRRWRPLGPHVRVVTGSPCQCTGWEEVQRCQWKPCLAISADLVMKACESFGQQLSASSSACSPPELVLQSRPTCPLN
jgi:ADP-heptose:LPS heptosyltransferase